MEEEIFKSSREMVYGIEKDWEYLLGPQQHKDRIQLPPGRDTSSFLLLFLHVYRKGIAG